MTEYRLVTFRQPASLLVAPRVGGVTSLTIDFLDSVPELEKAMAGWDPVGFQIIPIDEDFLLSVLLKTEVNVPDGVDLE